MTRTNNPNATDKSLVAQILRGDHQAFGLLIKNTEKLVASIVFKMIQIPEDRKDLAQDIYLKVYKHLPGFQFQNFLPGLRRLLITHVLTICARKILS